MDLRAYYRKLREVEATITEEHVVLVSMATRKAERRDADGSAEAIAAKLIAEGRARLANAEEAEEFRSGLRWRKRNRPGRSGAADAGRRDPRGRAQGERAELKWRCLSTGRQFGRRTDGRRQRTAGYRGNMRNQREQEAASGAGGDSIRIFTCGSSVRARRWRSVWAPTFG